jgi:acyl carrier protein
MGTSGATYEMVRGVLIEEFELDPTSVRLEASLVDDLGIDSIDAVDLLVRLKEITGKQVPPDRFRTVRSVGDVVSVLDTL